jgi:hypothetical protein
VRAWSAFTVMGSSRKKLNGFYIDMGPGEKTDGTFGPLSI